MIPWFLNENKVVWTHSENRAKFEPDSAVPIKVSKSPTVACLLKYDFARLSCGFGYVNTGSFFLVMENICMAEFKGKEMMDSSPMETCVIAI